jgi:ABC-type taurine transport system substrate-binding protein
MSTPRPRPQSPDDGSVTLFCTIASVGLLVLLGLIVDGGAKVRALQRADRVAAEAARVAGQAIDIPAAIEGHQPTANPAKAAAAGEAYLRANQVTGTVRILDGGRRIRVETVDHAGTVFLGVIGINSLTVHGSAEAMLVRGVTGANQ